MTKNLFLNPTIAQFFMNNDKEVTGTIYKVIEKNALLTKGYVNLDYIGIDEVKQEMYLVLFDNEYEYSIASRISKNLKTLEKYEKQLIAKKLTIEEYETKCESINSRLTFYNSFFSDDIYDLEVESDKLHVWGLIKACASICINYMSAQEMSSTPNSLTRKHDKKGKVLKDSNGDTLYCFNFDGNFGTTSRLVMSADGTIDTIDNGYNPNASHDDFTFINVLSDKLGLNERDSKILQYCVVNEYKPSKDELSQGLKSYYRLTQTQAHKLLDISTRTIERKTKELRDKIKALYSGVDSIMGCVNDSILDTCTK